VDIRGKLVVCFVNEPQPTEDQPDLFEGAKLTYYGAGVLHLSILFAPT
jgi:hypothetical protein